MNASLSFIVPQIDFIRRNYSPNIQELLSLMLQRDPKKRADLSVICRFKLVEPFYLQLKKEEYAFLSKPRSKR